MKYECTICQKPVQKLIEYLIMVVCILNMHRKKDVTKQNMIVKGGGSCNTSCSIELKFGMALLHSCDNIFHYAERK